MWIFYFFLNCLGIIFLSPIRWSVNLIVRFLFKKDILELDEGLFKKEPAKDLKDYAKEAHEELLSKIDKMKYNSDAVKFISLWYAATKDKKVFDFINKYITEDGYFLRTLDGRESKRGNFSGDMYAGLSYMITRMYMDKDENLTKEFVQKFEKAIKKTLTDKPYGVFKSKGFDEIDRGYFFKWFFSTAGHFLPYMITMKLLYKLTGKIRYNLLYFLVFPVVMVDILIDPTFVILTNKLVYLQWYFIHSNFLYYYSLYNLTENPLYKYGMWFIYKRFPYNPDFAGLYAKDEKMLKIWLRDYTHQFETVKTDESLYKDLIHIKKTFKSKKIVKERVYTRILPPRCRNNDYQWEKELNSQHNKYSVFNKIDYLHAYRLLKDFFKEEFLI